MVSTNRSVKSRCSSRSSKIRDGIAVPKFHGGKPVELRLD